MPASRLDTAYRSLVLAKFFTKGWGKPENLKKLFEFRKVISKRETCYRLVPKDYPVTITKETDLSDCILLDGQFRSPFEEYLPGLLPKVSETAFFQVLLPKKWQADHYKPVCLHLAGTGDHAFFLRRKLMAKPLLKEAGIGAALLMNPFYGDRRPKDQFRSYLLNVSDVFVMGGCLVLESLVLFNWCKRNGLGPFGVTGISMGGHMASLAATNWPEPIVLVPCLSWTTASAVFTKGVMSTSISWDSLEHQYFTDETYSKEIKNMVKIIDNDACYAAGQHFAKNFPDSLDHVKKISCAEPMETDQGKRDIRDPLVMVTAKGVKSEERGTAKLKDYFSWGGRKRTLVDGKKSFLWERKPKDLRSEQEKYEALQFMWGIMDECTHLSNFSIPVDTELVIAVAAKDDGYVPREGLTDIREVWRGAEVRYLNTGHVGACLLHRKVFRSAITDGFERLKKKYYAEETTQSQRS